jgi:hypothetical protein
MRPPRRGSGGFVPARSRHAGPNSTIRGWTTRAETLTCAASRSYAGIADCWDGREEPRGEADQLGGPTRTPPSWGRASTAVSSSRVGSCGERQGWPASWATPTSRCTDCLRWASGCPCAAAGSSATRVRHRAVTPHRTRRLRLPLAAANAGRLATPSSQRPRTRGDAIAGCGYGWSRSSPEGSVQLVQIGWRPAPRPGFLSAPRGAGPGADGRPREALAAGGARERSRAWRSRSGAIPAFRRRNLPCNRSTH